MPQKPLNESYVKYVSDWRSLRNIRSYEYMGHIITIRLRDSVWEFLFAHNENVISSFFKIDKSSDRNKRVRPYEEQELNNALNFVMAHANAAVEQLIGESKVGKIKLLLNKTLKWHNQATPKPQNTPVK